MRITGRNEEIDGYMCFVENGRNGKIIHQKQPLSEYLAKSAKAEQTLKDLVTMPLEKFVEKYGK